MPDDSSSVSATTSSGQTRVPQVAGGSINHDAAGMTALALLRRLRRECGVTGSDPANVTSLVGEMQSLFNYINQAWMEIQTMHTTWEFMRQPIEFTTVEGQGVYNTVEQLIASFSSYKKDSFRIYPLDQPESEHLLPFMPYDEFRDMHLFGTRRTQRQRPIVFTVNPQRDIILGPYPDGQYTVNGEGYAMPTEFTTDNQRPSMPPQYHMAIVYGAMMSYGAFEAAPEVYQRGEKQYKKLIAQLCATQLPQLTFGSPLA